MAERVMVATDFPAKQSVAVSFPFGPGRGKGEDYREGPNPGKGGVDYYNITVKLGDVQKGWSMDAPLHDLLVSCGLAKNFSCYIQRVPAGKTFAWQVWNNNEWKECQRMPAPPPPGAPPAAPPPGPPAPPQAPPPQAPPAGAVIPTSSAHETAGQAQGRTIAENAAILAECLMAADAAVRVGYDSEMLVGLDPVAKVDLIRNVAVTVYIQSLDSKNLGSAARRPDAKVLSEVAAFIQAMRS